MHEPLAATPRSTPVRRKQRGTHDRAAVNTILDEGLVCHVGFVHEGAPIVLPTAYARIGDQVYLHGALSNRMFNALASGAEACLTVTLVDALVLAKTAGHHSMNYRAVTLFGRGRRVTDRGELSAAFRAIVEAALPGRSAHTHAAVELDYTTTLVIAFPIAEGAAKIREAAPSGDPEDAVGFVGVVPLSTRVEVARPTTDSAAAAPHLSALGRVRDADVDALLTTLRAAYGWGDDGDRVVRARLARYRSAQPDGWFAAWAQRDGATAPELAAGGGALVFSSIAYFGLVGVAPAFQRRGLGRTVMERLLRFADARGATSLRLDASTAGEPLYRSMGFVTVDETRGYLGGAALGPRSADVRDAQPADHAALVAQDAAAYGGDRSALLTACLAEGRALVHARGGFCIAQSASIGPIVAPDVTAAAELLDAAVALPFAQPPQLLTRASQAPWIAELEARGFRHTRTLAYMARGPVTPQPEVFATQSLATG